ncbi:MAG TPA: IclR family transcriptional regulator [Kiloniellales bacterium]|nr:IclR family transcriptional regulator [Kiloniellales bacterium]
MPALRPAAEPSRAVLNAFAILDCFDQQHRRLSLAEISRRTGVPKATALRHLLALDEAGYVVIDDARQHYSLGSRALLLADRYLAQFDRLEVIRGALAELAEATGETAHYGVLEGTEMVYLEIAESPQRVRIYVRRGDRLPAHAVAGGKAVLAHESAETLAQFIAQGLAPLTSRTITRAHDFRAELATVRRRGYAANLGEWVDEVTAVSAPIFGPQDRVVGALGVAGPGTRLKAARVPEIGELVRRSAGRVSSLLGARRTAAGKG